MQFFKSYACEDGRYWCVSFVEGVYGRKEITREEADVISNRRTIWPSLTEAKQEIETLRTADF